MQFSSTTQRGVGATLVVARHPGRHKACPYWLALAMASGSEGAEKPHGLCEGRLGWRNVIWLALKVDRIRSYTDWADPESHLFGRGVSWQRH